MKKLSIGIFAHVDAGKTTLTESNAQAETSIAMGFTFDNSFSVFFCPQQGCQISDRVRKSENSMK